MGHRKPVSVMVPPLSEIQRALILWPPIRFGKCVSCPGQWTLVLAEPLRIKWLIVFPLNTLCFISTLGFAFDYSLFLIQPSGVVISRMRGHGHIN